MLNKAPYYLKRFGIKSYTISFLVRAPELLYKKPRETGMVWHPDNDTLYDTGIDAPTEIKFVQANGMIAIRIIILGFGGYLSVDKNDSV